jgi:hypothetical protein
MALAWPGSLSIRPYLVVDTHSLTILLFGKPGRLSVSPELLPMSTLEGAVIMPSQAHDEGCPRENDSLKATQLVNDPAE